MRSETVAGFVWLLLLAYVATKLPTAGRYRLAGYVHGRTLAATGGAHLHPHAADPGGDHVALYRRTR
jgi:hypothetical protein